MKKIAIIQSNYIPWKGYFDMINMVDELVFYDVVQYTKNDWRNRNKFKTPKGTEWVTIPVRQESLQQIIKDTKISDKGWARKHWKTIQHNFTKAKYFKDYKDIFEEFYLNCAENYLSQVNYKLINIINNILGIETKIRFAEEFFLTEGQTDRLMNICKQCQADIYLSGPAAMDYLNMDAAAKEGIRIEWMDYHGYPHYKQLFGDFVHEVSILDLIFNEGKNARNFMKSFSKEV